MKLSVEVRGNNRFFGITGMSQYINSGDEFIGWMRQAIEGGGVFFAGANQVDLTMLRLMVESGTSFELSGTEPNMGDIEISVRPIQ